MALQWQCEQTSWKKDDGQFIPYPASWLRAERWHDEPPRRKSEPVVDWAEECRREHKGICSSRYAHMEAMKYGLLPSQLKAIS